MPRDRAAGLSRIRKPARLDGRAVVSGFLHPGEEPRYGGAGAPVLRLDAAWLLPGPVAVSVGSNVSLHPGCRESLPGDGFASFMPPVRELPLLPPGGSHGDGAGDHLPAAAADGDGERAGQPAGHVPRHGRGLFLLGGFALGILRVFFRVFRVLRVLLFPHRHGRNGEPVKLPFDTLAQFRKRVTSKTQGYADDYAAISDLRKLASKHNIAIVIVHHDRKVEADDVFDTVSGTLGLTGAADTILIMKRQAGSVTLYVRGRDIEESETALQFSKQTCR